MLQSIYTFYVTPYCVQYLFSGKIKKYEPQKNCIVQCSASVFYYPV